MVHLMLHVNFENEIKSVTSSALILQIVQLGVPSCNCTRVREDQKLKPQWTEQNPRTGQTCLRNTETVLKTFVMQSLFWQRVALKRTPENLLRSTFQNLTREPCPRSMLLHEKPFLRRVLLVGVHLQYSPKTPRVEETTTTSCATSH